MPSIKIEDYHAAFLDRTARFLSRELRRPVSRREVLSRLLDLAIGDEGLYDPKSPGEPITATRRDIVHAERESRTSGLTSHDIVSMVLPE